MKKNYIAPETTQTKLHMKTTLLAGSLGGVKTSGLNNKDLIYENNSGDQGSAWSRSNNCWDE